jgi:transposase-like protein
MKYNNNNQKSYKNLLKCPKCNSTDLNKRGFFKTEAHGKRQVYYCKTCKKKFIERDGFYRMKNSSQKISLCLDLFFKGVSTRQIQSHLQQFYPHNSSWVSIYRWVIKYSEQISKFTDRLKLKSGHELQIDEIDYGIGRKKNRYFIDIIDTKTRFMVSSKFVKTRGKKEIQSVLRSAKKKTGTQTKIVTSDSFTGYSRNLLKSVFGYDFKNNRPKVVHNKTNARKSGRFNISIERLHNSIRQRTNSFRGFHGSISSANSIMKGIAINYNFVRKHQGLGCCPYELAVPKLKLGENKWLSLINLAN